MKLLNNRIAAVVFCLAAAVFSVFVLGGRKLSAERKIAEEAFFEGRNGYSAYQDLMERREYAANFLRAAEKMVPEEPAYAAAEKAFEDFCGAETLERLYDTNETLQYAAGTLYKVMEDARAAEEETFSRADKQYVNFNSKMNNLVTDDYYNGKAREYNVLCSKFPADLIGAVTGNGPLPVFERE